MMVLSRLAPPLASPPPAGERWARIVRCAGGEGPFRESEYAERPSPEAFAGAPASTSPLRGEVRRSRVNPNSSHSAQHEATADIAAVVQAAIRLCAAALRRTADRTCRAARRRSGADRGIPGQDLRYLPA